MCTFSLHHTQTIRQRSWPERSAFMEEQKKVIAQGISTYFDIKEISSHPVKMHSDIKGKLRRFIGIKELPAIAIHYRLSFSNSLGRMHLVGFEQVKEEEKSHV